LSGSSGSSGFNPYVAIPGNSGHLQEDFVGYTRHQFFGFQKLPEPIMD
jgi:hypothetical protein